MTTRHTPDDATMIRAAQRLRHRDGDLEIDEPGAPLPTGRVSRADQPDADGGAYVLAWVWVYDTDVRPEDRKGDR